MIATFQSLRFLFVMMIFMSHFAYRGVAPFDAGGDCGVAFFFLLSGFSLSMGYGPGIADGTFRYGRYLRRRLVKVFPLHLLCLLAFLLLFRPEIDACLPLNALLLQSWIPDADCYFSYNGVSWFLSTLLFSYLLFPLAYRGARPSSLAVLLVLYIAVYLAVPYDRVNALLYVSPPVRFVDFFLGVMLYKFYQRHPLISLPRWTEPLLVLLLAAALCVYPVADEKLRTAPLYWVILLPLVYVFARQEGQVSRLLRHRTLRWLGTLSMPIFLLHPMTFRALFHFFPALPPLLMLVLSFTVILALSIAAARILTMIQLRERN